LGFFPPDGVAYPLFFFFEPTSPPPQNSPSDLKSLRALHMGGVSFVRVSLAPLSPNCLCSSLLMAVELWFRFIFRWHEPPAILFLSTCPSLQALFFPRLFIAVRSHLRPQWRILFPPSFGIERYSSCPSFLSFLFSFPELRHPLNEQSGSNFFFALCGNPVGWSHSGYFNPLVFPPTWDLPGDFLPSYGIWPISS